MDVAALKARGNAAFAAGEFGRAVESYSQAISALDQATNPQEQGLHLLYGNRAAAHLKLGQWAPALQDAEAALDLEPRWSKALFRKAAALQKLGLPAAAAAAARQALQVEPGNKDVQALLRQLEQEEAAAGAATDSGQQEAQAEAAGPRKPVPTAAMLPLLLARAPWELVPASDGTDENLLLLLHGLGDRPGPFAALARRMALPQTAALALGGPQEVPFSDGGRSWYTVFDEEFELIEGRPGEQRRLRSLQEAVAGLQQLLGRLQAACGYRPRCIHLLGFSQGGTVALELARQQAACGQPLGSCVAISAGLLPEQLPGLLQQQGAGKGAGKQEGGIPVLITRGTLDQVVSQQSVEQTARALRSVHGMQVEVAAVPGKAHSMPQGEAEMRQLMAFWARHLSRRPTAADLPAGAGGPGDLLEIRPGEVSIERVEQ